MAVFSPRVAASRAHPAPVAPPPITKTSNWKKVVTIELGNNQIKYYTKKYSLCSNILIWLNFSGPFLAPAPYKTFLKNVFKSRRRSDINLVTSGRGCNHSTNCSADIHLLFEHQYSD